MPSPLSPTAQDVQALDDVALRQLLIQLCQAELANAGRSVSGLTAGGDQNAPDGGLDLRVESSGPELPYLPSFPVGVQVKAEAMGPAKIGEEMRPKPTGEVRPVLIKLAQERGSYIIASGRDNCADRRLQERRTAMATAVANIPAAEHLNLRFYDADQLARWVETHPGVAMWLARAVGAPTDGWRPYGPWSTPSLADAPPFLPDEAARVRQDTESDTRTVIQALADIRKHLATPRGVVRLVGLSGMGKTRVAQALFESLPGSEGDEISPTLAVYGDVSALQGVLPEAIAERLAYRKVRAVLVVDNCPASLHRRLVTAVRQTGSQLSLLTIDFDVGDGPLADTATFRLEEASGELIDALLQSRAPALSGPDRRRIVGFAGGNTRIALALAANNEGQGLAQLRDEELLGKLFLDERRAPDDVLRRVARACALVNAFDISLTGVADEVAVLARLANVDAFTLHEKLGDLLDRGLAQKRGVQRAILPHALAVRLADEAFRRLPPGLIWESLFATGPERLKGSFVRRLSLLHETPAATEIAERLLAPGGPYAISPTSPSPDWDVFISLAPLAEARALDLVAAAAASADPVDATFRWRLYDKVGALLLAFAYEPEHFETATQGLYDLITRFEERHRGDQLQKAFAGLFQASSSGTLAPPSVKFAVLEGLLRRPAAEQMVTDLLDATLRVKMPAHPLLPAFGARPRTRGWKPLEDDGWRAWYGRALEVAARVAADDVLGPAYRPRLARSLGEMLRIDLLRDLAIAALRQAAAAGFWRDGWFAVCRRLASYGRAGSTAPPEIICLERDLRPKSSTDRYDAWVLGDPSDWRDPENEEPGNWARFFSHARQFGADLAHEDEARALAIARAIVDREAKGFALGEGMGGAMTDLQAGWAQLIGAMRAAPSGPNNPTLLQGYIEAAALRDPAQVSGWLEEVAEDPILRPYVVDLQVAARQTDAAGSLRMLEALRAGAVAPIAFQQLQNARRTHSMPNDLLSDILLEMAARGGLSPAISVLHMRYHGADEAPIDDNLADAGRTLLAAAAASEEDLLGGSQVVQVAKVCLPGPEGRPVAEALARGILTRRDLASSTASDHAMLASLIFTHHADVGLDVFLGDSSGAESSDLGWVIGGHDDDDEPDHRPVGLVSERRLIAWVEVAPETRAPRLANHIAYFNGDGEAMTWTPIALWLMHLPGLAAEITKIFGLRFVVGSYSGSAARRWERRLGLVGALVDDDNPDVAAWAREQQEWLRARVSEEEALERTDGQRFE